MKPIKNHILVSVNIYEKDEVNINGNTFKTGKNYNENFRERNPVVAFVEHGNKEIPTNSYIICNYNHFTEDSPYVIAEHLTGTKEAYCLYSIPVNEEIFAKVDINGNLIPVCGNLLVDRLMVDNFIDIPDDLKKERINQAVALTGQFKGKLIFFLPYSNYTICYNWNGEERRAIKIFEKEITGFVKNN